MIDHASDNWYVNELRLEVVSSDNVHLDRGNNHLRLNWVEKHVTNYDCLSRLLILKLFRRWLNQEVKIWLIQRQVIINNFLDFL